MQNEFDYNNDGLLNNEQIMDSDRENITVEEESNMDNNYFKRPDDLLDVEESIEKREEGNHTMEFSTNSDSAVDVSPKEDYSYHNRNESAIPPMEERNMERRSVDPDGMPYHVPKKRYQRRKKRFPFGAFLGIVGLCGILAGTGLGLWKYTHRPQPEIKTTTTSQSPKSEKDSIPQVQDVSSIVENTMPSVVSITGIYEINDLFGFASGQAEGAGSGFIISQTDDKLFIATNNHVVANSSSLKVAFIDSKAADATLVGKDTNADLAVLSVNKKDLSKETLDAIQIAVLGSSDDLKVGQPVIAIGNALGYGQSVTTGVISAKDREVPFTDGTMHLLQTDAAINPGNSGGVLINLKGEVVGINNSKIATTEIEGVGYAIPISTANEILNDLMNAKDIDAKDSGYLGIMGKDINDAYSKAFNMPVGIYVSHVEKDSPAEKAGIQAGDILTKIDKTTLTDMAGLKDKLSRTKANTNVNMELQRLTKNGNYKKHEVKVKLGRAGDYFKEEELNNNSSEGTTQKPEENNPLDSGEITEKDIQEFFEGFPK